MQGSLHFWIGRNDKPHIIKIHKSRIRTHKRVHYVLTERYFDDGVVKIPQGLTLSYFVVQLKKKNHTIHNSYELLHKCTSYVVKLEYLT